MVKGMAAPRPAATEGERTGCLLCHGLGRLLLVLKLHVAGGRGETGPSVPSVQTLSRDG